MLIFGRTWSQLFQLVTHVGVRNLRLCQLVWEAATLRAAEKVQNHSGGDEGLFRIRDLWPCSFCL